MDSIVTECGLYIEMNETLPDLLDLDVNITSHVCCTTEEPQN
jgi:hypothetical protein